MATIAATPSRAITETITELGVSGNASPQGYSTSTASDVSGNPATVNLSSGQTGNGDSTNVMDRGGSTGPGLLKITSTVGATPTVTVNIMGSANGTDFINIPYAGVATPTTVAVAALAAITTATTSYYYLQSGYPWRYLKLVYSANTNVTLTVDCWAF